MSETALRSCLLQSVGQKSSSVSEEHHAPILLRAGNEEDKLGDQVNGATTASTDGGNRDNEQDAGTYEEVVALDLAIVKKSTAVKVFELVVAMVAFLDFASEMLNQFWQPSTRAASYDHQHDLKYTAMIWLRENGSNIALLFSCFWFIDAFVVAHRKRLQACRRIDQNRLLGRTAASAGSPLAVENAVADRWHLAWWIYILTVTIQLLLLPVGFYTTLYQWTGHDLDRLVVESTTPKVSKKGIGILVWWQQRTAPVNNSTATMNVYQRLTAEANVALMIVLLKHYTVKASLHTQFLAQKYYNSSLRSLVRYVLVNAVRRPRVLRRQIRKTLDLARWARYLAPIIGPFNALNDKLSDLRKTCKQRILAKVAQKDRERVRQALSPDELRLDSAIRIQAAYRSRRARCYLQALALLQGKREKWLTLKLQMACRAWLRRARARLAAKCAELKELQAKQQRQGSQQMTVVERRNLYQLQQELQEMASHFLNKMFLMRPDSTFIVAWRTILVVAVLIDIAVAALVPILAQQKDPRTGEPLTIQTYFHQNLLPTPVGDLAACKNFQYDSFPSMEGNGVLNQAMHALTTLATTTPWYCHPLYAAMQNCFAALVDCLIRRFYTIVACFLFLDVFVCFFTGDIDPRTGSVVAENFTKRWIVPGILIQLAVNPQMETTSKLIWSAMCALLRRCPFRVLRWTVALFYPTARAIGKAVKYAWRKLVVTQNKAATRQQRRKSILVRRSQIGVRWRSSVVTNDYVRRATLLKADGSFQRRVTASTVSSDSITQADEKENPGHHRRSSTATALSEFQAIYGSK